MTPEAEVEEAAARVELALCRGDVDLRLNAAADEVTRYAYPRRVDVDRILQRAGFLDVSWIDAGAETIVRFRYTLPSGTKVRLGLTLAGRW